MEMDMEFLRKLPTPKELKEQFPVSEKIAAIKEDRDRQIREIFEGKDDRLLLIIGPCSADNEDAVIDYISRLRTVQDKVADKIFYDSANLYQQTENHRYGIQGHAASAGSGKERRHVKGYHRDP